MKHLGSRMFVQRLKETGTFVRHYFISVETLAESNLSRVLCSCVYRYINPWNEIFVYMEGSLNDKLQLAAVIEHESIASYYIAMTLYYIYCCGL